jgi:hypothetical protein
MESFSNAANSWEGFASSFLGNIPATAMGIAAGLFLFQDGERGLGQLQALKLFGSSPRVRGTHPLLGLLDSTR